MLKRFNHTVYSMTIAAAAFGGGVIHAEDLGNGYYSNPVIWADAPDPDVIRVGDTYYMVTTTMHLMPGAPVMKSKDLVNWEIASYIFDTLNDNDKYSLKNGNIYGKGQWATSLKYHDGKFYALFSPNDQPYKSYLYTTDDPSSEDGWKLIARGPHFHDSSLFFDDDNRVYVISGSGDIRLNELKSDLSGIKEDGITGLPLNLRDPEETNLLEGSRMVKHDGRYYLLAVSWPLGKPRRQLCYRADKITGPYEKKVVLEDNFAGFGHVGQGTIVDDATGNWWGMIFQDRGGVGRVLTLSPCRWIDGWPVIGDDGGRVPEVYVKPEGKSEGHCIVASDDFGSDSLKNVWQWNHNPEPNAASLSAREGWLRLTATGSHTPTVYHARNTLSQRMEGPECRGVVKLDISHMNPGDKAGFAAFNGHTGCLTVSRYDKGFALTMNSQVVDFNRAHDICRVTDAELGYAELPEGECQDIYLRIDADFNLGKDIARFSYSLDGDNWRNIGVPFKMMFDYRRLFMGTRMAIFNYSSEKDGGYIECDYFDYTRKGDTGNHNTGSPIKLQR